MTKPEETDLHELKELLIGNLSAELSELQSLLEAKNWEKLAQKANQAAGDAGLHELLELSSSMRRLEQAAKQGDKVEALHLLEALTEFLCEVR